MYMPRTSTALAACVALMAMPVATAAQGDDDGAAAAETMAPMASGVMVQEAWSRPSPMAEGAGVAYMRLVNMAEADDTLIGVSSAAAEVVEMHETADDEGMMSMLPVQSIEVPAGGEVALEPGGYHIMLVRLVEPLAEGDVIELTLEFENAGVVPVSADVLPFGSEGPMDDMDMGDMDMDDDSMDDGDADDMEMDAEASPAA